MAEHPEVFISATTRDLGSYRAAIQNALLTLGIFPIQQDDFALAYGQLTDMLRQLVGRCNAVIHLAGFHYGAEPTQPPQGEPRRSYTQIEYDVARELGKPIYLFLATEDATDKALAQTDEEKGLQMAHRQAIQRYGDVYYPFASPEEVASRVRELRFPARSADAPRRVVNLPYISLGPLFKGRDVALAELRQRLTGSEGRVVGLTARQAIHGLGGVGKTRLAIEYSWRHASDYENALLFVSVRSPTDFRVNLAALCNAEILNLPEQHQAEESVRLTAVFRWLGEHSGWLVIFDNADTPEAAVEVEKSLPKFQGGHVIITSRIADWSAAVQTTELDVLGDQDAAAFLLERTEPRRKKTAADTEDAAGLAHELGGLALALEQAGAYIAKNRFSFSEYRRRWESTREKVLAWYDERLMKYPSSVATTWQTTFDQLTLAERALLNILARFAPESIPVSLLEGVPMGGVDARDALSGLVSWSLARWNADGDAFTIHRLVQEITRQRLSDNEKESALERALEILDAKLPSPEWDQTGWQLWERLAPHCRTLLGRVRDHRLESKATRMMNDLGVWLTNRAEHGEAEPLFQRGLAIREKVLDPEHLDVASSLNNLAELYHRQGRYVEAEPLFERARAIREKAPGSNRPELARSLQGLAVVFRRQGRYRKAEPLLQRAQKIVEEALGADHPDVAWKLEYLAELYRDQDQYVTAESLFHQAGAIFKKTMGPEHPVLARNLQSLATLYRRQGRHVEAKPLFEQAQRILENKVGSEHPDVAWSLYGLAESYRALGQYEKAKPLFERARAIREKALGPNHPELARSLQGLAELYRNQGYYEEAKPLFERARAIFKKALGPEHPDGAQSLQGLAMLYRDQGEYGEGESLFRLALAIREKTLGPVHHAVANSLNGLALLLQDTNRLSEAEPLVRRGVVILLKITNSTGHLHPNLHTVFSNYFGLLTEMSLSQEEIFKRIAELGQEAGFDSESYGKLLERVSEPGVETRQGV
jgi:tetratricopeptide (TPR) repeat protein